MVPQTLLSFLYHITEVSPYRDEMHHDMRQAMRRFDIDLGMMARLGPGGMGRLADVRRASFEVERASYANRAVPVPPGTPVNELAKPAPLRVPVDDVPYLQVPMQQATLNLFSAAVPFLAWELENEVPGPDQPAPLDPNDPDTDPNDVTLLRRVYLLFYSKKFRALSPDPGTWFPVPPVPGVNPAVFAAAWTRVRHALDLPRGQRVTRSEIEPALTILMTALGVEFAESAWAICW